MAWHIRIIKLYQSTAITAHHVGSINGGIIWFDLILGGGGGGGTQAGGIPVPPHLYATLPCHLVETRNRLSIGHAKETSSRAVSLNDPYPPLPSTVVN